MYNGDGIYKNGHIVLSSIDIIKRGCGEEREAK